MSFLAQSISDFEAQADAVDFSLLLLRVSLGLTLAAHGYGKFFTGGRLPGTAGWFDSMGMKPGKVHALLAASTEVGAGLMFAVGLLTPFAAAGFVGLMVVAGWTVHRNSGFFIVKSGWEYNFILAIVPACVAGIGPGRFSIDRVLEIDYDLSGWFGLLTALILGIGGSVGLLAACYRPPVDAG